MGDLESHKGAIFTSWFIKTRFLLILITATKTTIYRALSNYGPVCKVPLVCFLHYIVEASLKPCEVYNAVSYSEAQGGSFHHRMRPALWSGHRM